VYAETPDDASASARATRAARSRRLEEAGWVFLLAGYAGSALLASAHAYHDASDRSKIGGVTLLVPVAGPIVHAGELAVWIGDENPPPSCRVWCVNSAALGLLVEGPFLILSGFAQVAGVVLLVDAFTSRPPPMPRRSGISVRPGIGPGSIGLHGSF
jgi:hypothetical protein